MKAKMTRGGFREFIFLTYFKAVGAFELSKVIGRLHELGCVGMNDSRVKAVSDAAARKIIYVHVKDFHNEELRIFCEFGPMSMVMFDKEEKTLSDLLSIEVVEEPDYKQKFEECMGLLIRCEQEIFYGSKLSDDIKQFIEENKEV